MTTSPLFATMFPVKELSTKPSCVWQRQWRARNWEKAREIEKRSRAKHPDKYYPEKKREYYKLYVVKKRTPEWYRNTYSKSRDKILAACRRYRQKHQAARNARSREYYKAHRLKILERNKNWARRTHYAHVTNLRKRDLNVRLKYRLGARMRSAIRARNFKKENRTQELLGCTIPFFRQFLEHQFTKEMTWENYGSYWHVDHIIPVNLFDLRIVEQQKKAFHYSNCRPLEAKKNIAKSDKPPGPHQALLL